MWARKEGAFEGIVPLEVFMTAQEIITARSARPSDEELLDHLKRLYADAGQLSGMLIDQDPDMPSSATYRGRFGSLTRAYEMIGYRTERDHERVALNKRLREMHPEIITRTEAAIADVGGSVTRDTRTDLLILNDELVISLVLARCQPLADGQLRWRIRFDPMRKMKAARQVEAVELMIAANSITAAHADALFKATPPEQRTDYTPTKPEESKGDPLEQIVKLEREMSNVQEKYKDAEKSYGSELLNLVVAKGYLAKLLENDAVRSWLGRHAADILEQFDRVINTTSMEEALEQQEHVEETDLAELNDPAAPEGVNG